MTYKIRSIVIIYRTGSINRTRILQLF